MNDSLLREQLVALLKGGEAHMPVENGIRDYPVAFSAARITNIPHTPWRLLEHMRIAQWDILEFCRNADHVSPEFPDGYWPEGNAAPSPEAWQESVASFCADLGAMQRLVADPQSDLFTALPHGTGQTLLREALLVADHNSYHLGQLVAIRRGLEGASA